MKPRLHMGSLVFCFGSSSITCEKVLSGAKRCARKAFAVLLCFCFISISVFAADVTDMGYFSPSSDIGVFWKNTNYDVNIFNGYFPAMFERGEGVVSNARYIYGDVLPGQVVGVSQATSFYSASDFYIDVIFPVTVVNQVTVTPHSTFKDIWNIRFGLGTPPSGVLKSYKPYSVSFYLDGVYTDLTDSSGDGYWSGVPSSFEVKRYWGFRFYFNQFSYNFNATSQHQPFLAWTFQGTYLFEPDYLQGTYDEVVVNTGILQEVNGKLTEIQTSTSTIMNDVSDIKDTVLDVSEQLQDSDSNIWQAAGEKISETVTGLFVPTEAELDAKKQELEQKLDDKLGSLTDLRDTGDQLVDGVVSGFTGGGRNYQFEFPGISVPMNGQDYVILSPQTVSLENKAFKVFQDALAVGIGGLCFFSLIHICEDAIYCIISGVSYWGFIRSRHDR